MAECDELESSTENDIRCNLMTFLPYVVDCVKATDILVHLQYFTREQRKEIFQMSNRNGVAAARRAIHILLDEVDEPGRFKAFMDMAVTSGYPRVVQMLSGKCPNDENYRKIIDLFMPRLVEGLEPLQLLPVLVQNEVLFQNDVEMIRAEEMNHGNMRASMLLLHYLPCRQEDWFKYFLIALIENMCSELAETLDPDLFQKIKAQRYGGDTETLGNDSSASQNRSDDDVRENIMQDEGEVDRDVKAENCLPDDLVSKIQHLKLFDNDIDDRIVEKENLEGSEKKDEAEENVTTQAKEIIDDAVLGVMTDGVDTEGFTEAKQVVATAVLGEITDGTDTDDLTEAKQVLVAGTESDQKQSNDLSVEQTETIYNRQGTAEGSVPQDDAEEWEFNIKTDEDELEDIEDKDFSLRNYQKELAKEGIEGENVIVMAPTNSGKTRVAFKIMQEHFRRYKRERKIAKVIFLVENEALATQQGKECAELLSAYRTKIISGSSQRDRKQYLRDFVDRRDILIVTVQVLVNALKGNEIKSLTKFSMIVFDECHHTNDQHPYNQIMSRYVDLKLDPDTDCSNLPQIIGLTASLSVGGNTDVNKAKLYMKQVMANLDVNYLCTVRQHKKELKQYENPPYEEIVTAAGRKNDVYRRAVVQAMLQIDQLMITHPCMANLHKNDVFIRDACRVPRIYGSEKFIQWLSDFVKCIAELKSDEARRLLNTCRLHLEVYNKSLLMHNDARVRDAMALVDVFMNNVVNNPLKDETNKELVKIFKELKTVPIEDIPENPKLIKMQQLVLNMLEHDENARCIIFVKTRELAMALVTWMNETHPLKPMKATEFVGQSASASLGGMTKSRQLDALDFFRDGRHKVIIATSVAEEGLDITKCNLVIRYEHVTNEVVRLQSRGRARAPNSKYYVLTEVGSWIVAKEEKNALLEQLMNRIIPVLQQYMMNHQNEWVQTARETQEQDKLSEKLRKTQREQRMEQGPFELQCLNCSNFICMSSDIKKIQNCHHVVIEDSVKENVRSFMSTAVEFEENELKYGGATRCKECMSNLGGVCEYKGAEFPLLKISQFRIVDKHGKGTAGPKKWKKANFVVEPFTLEDLQYVVDQRLADE